MRCPIDNETLVMADRNGVEIDYCPKCRGVWLDRGELDKIIDRAAGAGFDKAPTVSGHPAPVGLGVAPVYQPEPQRAGVREEPRYRQDDDDDDDRYRGKRKRRDSFLGDLFDF
jgi:uncharacterized protein